ncbi:MBT domain-containing protein 1-like isoform X2 [Convolutriloba macropyga]|uniref:MBT domain-containing protein 1-like isoform X2 n=1 Tax=Convolutriloba macropyga TaxID=536237 RepID=UPI003F528DC3
MADSPPSCNFSHFTKQGIPPDIFSWKRYLQKSAGTATCPPLEAFSDRIPLPICWTRKLIGLYIEFSVRSNQRFWYYKVVDTKGYYILLETLGNESEQVWISLACPHYRGFSHLDKKMLASNIMNTPFDSNEKMRMKLLKQMHGAQEIGDKFVAELHYLLRKHRESICKLSVGKTVEALDKTYFGSVRQAFIKNITANGHIVELYYRPLKKKQMIPGKTCEEMMEDDDSVDNHFWVTPSSTLIHPVGWAKEVNHTNDTPYACQCIPTHKQELGASFNIPPFEKPQDKTSKFKKGMKLEMVDPLTLNNIRVGTIVKVLKFGNLMIAVDGKGGQIPPSHEHFCVPVNSPLLLPLGFCVRYGTQLKPPPSYRGPFLWPDYLHSCGAIEAPDSCFVNFEALDEGKARLMVGNKVETVDIMSPSTILPATVTAVAGHLIRLNFDSWPSDMDQWKYMYSEDIFPIGFCELVNFNLMPPKKYLNAESAKQFGVIFEEVEVDDNQMDTTDQSFNDKLLSPDINSDNTSSEDEEEPVSLSPNLSGINELQTAAKTPTKNPSSSITIDDENEKENYLSLSIK